MEGLTKLLAPLHSGKPLLDALKSSRLSDSILPGLIAEVVTEAQASGNRAGPTAAPIPTPGSTSAQETALSSIDQLSFANPRCSARAYRRGLARRLVSAGKPSLVTKDVHDPTPLLIKLRAFAGESTICGLGRPHSPSVAPRPLSQSHMPPLQTSWYAHGCRVCGGGLGWRGRVCSPCHLKPRRYWTLSPKTPRARSMFTWPSPRPPGSSRAKPRCGASS